MKSSPLLSALAVASATSAFSALSAGQAEAVTMGSTFSIQNFTGDTAQVDFTLSDTLDGVQFDVSIAQPPTIGGDLFGFFASIKNDNVAGITGGLSGVTGSDVTNVVLDANSVINLGQGNNLNGFQGDKFDLGVTFGGPGLGGLPPITSTSFTVAGLTTADFADQFFGARLQSTGISGEGSSKLAGEGELVGGTQVPEPMTVLGTALAVGIGALFQKKKASQKKRATS